MATLSDSECWSSRINPLPFSADIGMIRDCREVRRVGPDELAEVSPQSAKMVVGTEHPVRLSLIQRTKNDRARPCGLSFRN
jgi:hypothetical protein